MREIRLYDGKAYGYEVSKYGLENRYLDYLNDESYYELLRRLVRTVEKPSEWLVY